MNTKQLLKLGIPFGEPMHRAKDFIANYLLKGGDRSLVEHVAAEVVGDPAAHLNDPLRGALARSLLEGRSVARAEPVPWKQWGTDLDAQSIEQIENACRLPVSVRAALMPDAHVGYGLPIGGVLATDNAVIPYAVGVDIACRMKMTVLDLPVSDLDRRRDWLREAIETETKFGVGAHFRERRQHGVMDRDWSVSPVTKSNKDKAWSQLGTSGSGNHFVEFGTFTAREEIHGLGPGDYLALLSHSGSRGTGAAVCAHYSKAAARRHSGLPRELQRLAWLDLDSAEGQEYWRAMNLMGEYAAANHACIHRHVARHLGAEVLLDLENHHNFAWKETHEIDGRGREVIVHRKGATPAGPGVLGIIPGSMATPGFVVRGRGNAGSLNSAAHGAGRVMSRTQATKTFNWKDANRFLKERGVTLISAGLDEVPMVYKNIHDVMAAQSDLVDILGEFNSKLVKMAPAGERPED
ncbi:MAG TPA: RtcB family protein [Methylomirabilota bacterium]|nr:RtcB family protein [Methylomirabilota bacterium]